MNNIITLAKANILNSWGINKILKSKSKAEKVKAGLIGVAIVYAFCMLLFAMFMMNYPLAGMLEKYNALDLLISNSILSTTLVTIFLSIYKIPGYIFAFKDYDLLMSLPVKPSAILTSKMIFIYWSNFLVSLMVGLPPLVVYGIKTSKGGLFYAFSVIIIFFVPLIPISIGAVFAYILGRVSSKVRSTNAFLMIGSLLLTALVVVGSILIPQVKPEQLQNSIPTISELNNILFWSRIYINALKDTDIFYMLAFILLSVLVFSIFIVVCARGFKSINAKMSEKYKSSSYKMTRLKTSSPFKALYFKELRFYFSSYIYVLNTAMGVIMMTVFSVGTAVFGRETVAKVLEIPMAEAYFVPIIAMMFAFCINLTFTTAPSISLEGKNLWIIKTIPVDVKSIFWSKILLNLTLTVPASIINTIIVSIGFKLDFIKALTIIIVALMYCVFASISGLLVNLHYPKFEWPSHIAVVKQSASVLIEMVIGFVSIIIPIVLFVLIRPKDPNVFILIYSAALAALNIFLARYLNTKGVRKFQEL